MKHAKDNWLIKSLGSPGHRFGPHDKNGKTGIRGAKPPLYIQNKIQNNYNPLYPLEMSTDSVIKPQIIGIVKHLPPPSLSRPLKYFYNKRKDGTL
jgi:hypothetical protein